MTVTETLRATLAQELEADHVSLERLSKEYKPVLEMVRELIGVIPNCYPVLAIWPAGFRTFNLLVPSLLNLPAALIGQGAQKDLVGIALYASSNAAGCPYCTAHHCSFAIRRGADRDALLGERSPTEAAVADLAEAMAVVPARVTPEHLAAVDAVLSPDDVEWIVLAVSLGGFLNKVMDSLGIRLEDEAVADVQALLEPTGWNPGKHLWSSESIDGQEAGGRTLASARAAWSAVDRSDEIPVDGLATYLRVFRQAPGAARLERDWTKGVSGRVGPVLLMLEEEIGYAFPVLSTIASPKVVKAIATTLRDNLDPAQSAVGLQAKLLAGLVYAESVGSGLLASECMVLVDLLLPDADPKVLAAIRRFAADPVAGAVVPPGLSAKDAAAILLAKAASPSPSAVSEITVATIRPQLESAEIIEIVVWLGVLQALNRLYSVTEVRLLAEAGGEAVAPAQAAAAPPQIQRDAPVGPQTEARPLTA